MASTHLDQSITRQITYLLTQLTELTDQALGQAGLVKFPPGPRLRDSGPCVVKKWRFGRPVPSVENTFTRPTTGLRPLCRNKQTIRQSRWPALYGARTEIWYRQRHLVTSPTGFGSVKVVSTLGTGRPNRHFFTTQRPEWGILDRAVTWILPTTNFRIREVYLYTYLWRGAVLVGTVRPEIGCANIVLFFEHSVAGLTPVPRVFIGVLSGLIQAVLSVLPTY